MSKLYCYSHKAFRDKLLSEQWCDSTLPSNAAFICIGCTPDCQDYMGGMFGLFDKFDLSDDNDNVLNVRFDDIDCESKSVQDSILENRYHRITGISYQIARQIVEFINKNIGKDFYIHCNAGKSRSQAVVRFILDTYKDREWELNPLNPNTTWNMFVYRSLVNAYSEMNEGC